MKIADLDPERRDLLLAMGFPASKAVGALNGYPSLSINRQNVYVHRLVAAHYLAVPLSPDLFVHHEDEDRTNFRPENLKVCSHGEHNGLHRKFGHANHFFGRRHAEETKEKIAELARGRDMPRAPNGTFMKGDASCATT